MSKIFLPIVQGKPKPEPLCVMTYNVGYDEKAHTIPDFFRNDAIALLARDSRVDIICLQEVIWKGDNEQVEDMGRAFADWHTFAVSHNEQNHYQNMIVSRYPVVPDSEMYHTIVSSAGRQNRVNLSVQVVAPIGVVRVFCIHTRFEESREGIVQSLRWVREVMRDEPGVPVVIAGDFNKERGGVAEIAREWDLDVTIAKVGRIDLILVAGLIIVNSWVAARPALPGDHQPVLALLGMGKEEVVAEDFFPRAVEFVLSVEGGFVNHESDPGGATNMGITIGTLSRWLGRAATVEEVKNLTRADAITIYRQFYWEESGALAARDYPTAVLLFDSGVLHGVGAPQAWVEEYGLDAWRILARRLRVYTASKNWGVFGKGWVNRIHKLMDEMGKD